MIGESNEKTKTIDSLGYQTEFDNYTTLETEIYRLKNKLTRQGYVDTTIKNISKQTDTLFKA